MPLLKTQAIALKSQRCGEADRIVSYYTLQLGRVRGIARGARRLKSRFGSALEPFVHVDLTLLEKRRDTLYRISQADILDSFTELSEELALISAAARMVNLVTAVTAERDPAPRIFATLLGGLRSLREGSDPSLTALLFQIQVLGHTGFRPQTDQCAACSQSINLRSVRFSAISGGLVCVLCARTCSDRCLPISPGGVAFIQQARRLAFPKVTRLRATGQVRREVEAAIDTYVRIVVGKRLPLRIFWSQKDRPWSTSKKQRDICRAPAP